MTTMQPQLASQARFMTKSLHLNFEQSLVDNLKANSKGFGVTVANSKTKVKTGIALLTILLVGSMQLLLSKKLNYWTLTSVTSTSASKSLETLPRIVDFNYEQPFSVGWMLQMWLYSWPHLKI